MEYCQKALVLKLWGTDNTSFINYSGNYCKKLLRNLIPFTNDFQNKNFISFPKSLVLHCQTQL